MSILVRPAVVLDSYGREQPSPLSALQSVRRPFAQRGAEPISIRSLSRQRFL
jgi:hypothetical protein